MRASLTSMSSESLSSPGIVSSTTTCLPVVLVRAWTAGGSKGSPNRPSSRASLKSSNGKGMGAALNIRAWAAVARAGRAITHRSVRCLIGPPILPRPARGGTGEEGVSCDLDFVRLGLLGLGQMQLQDAVAHRGAHLGGLALRRQREGAVKGPARRLAALPAVLLLGRLALSRDDQGVVLDLYLHVLLLEPGQVDVHGDLLVGLADVHGRGPRAVVGAGKGGPGPQKVLEQAVDRLSQIADSRFLRFRRQLHRHSSHPPHSTSILRTCDGLARGRKIFRTRSRNV